MEFSREEHFDIERRVIKIVAEEFGVTTNYVSPESKFKDLGADSLDAIEFIMELEEEFNEGEFELNIPDSEAENILTVAQAISCVERFLAKSTD